MIHDEPANIERVWPVPMDRQDALRRLSELIEDPEVAQKVWDAHVGLLYDTLASRQVYSNRMRCRVCGRPHPSSSTGVAWAAKGQSVPDHPMHCPNYVGPLEHRLSRYEGNPAGTLARCICGAAYDDAGGGRCPDADLFWRGPTNRN